MRKSYGTIGRELYEKKKKEKLQPDEPFPYFRAWKYVDRLILCSSRTSCDGFWSSKIVKGLVGKAGPWNLRCLACVCVIDGFLTADCTQRTLVEKKDKIKGNSPDRPFREFRVSRFIGPQTLFSSETSIHGFWRSIVVEGSVRLYYFIPTWSLPPFSL